jgi:hypothetical protein
MDIETVVETAAASTEEEGFTRQDLTKIALTVAATAVAYVGAKKVKRLVLTKLATKLEEHAVHNITDLPENAPETVNA